ncbi:MAG: hypothetical protein JSS87_01760 [Acidobacteria bacterium]|nr:hypothetical protein [Acidobacteriota bacterium]
MKSNGVHVHPIHNEHDHEQALARIDQLMDAAAGTPEGEELDALVTLVDAYEPKHHAIDAVTEQGSRA